MIRDKFGEVEADEWHFPKYTKGCWGNPRHNLCWMCKLRVPYKILKLIFRVRRDH